MSNLQPNPEEVPTVDIERRYNHTAGAIGAVIGGGGFLALSFVGETPEISDNFLVSVTARVCLTAMGGIVGYDVGANPITQDIKNVYRTLFPKA